MAVEKLIEGWVDQAADTLVGNSVDQADKLFGD
jgi:hypothetical protein